MNWKKTLFLVFLVSLLIVISCATKIKESAPLSKIDDSKEKNIMNDDVKEQENASDDLTQLVKTVVDLPDLQNYFHIEQTPDRKPLYILKNDVIKSDLKLSKFGEQIRFATCDELKKLNKPYLEFTKLAIKNDKADVVFRYRVEGIEGNVSLTKSGDGWKASDQRISEVKFEDDGCSGD